MSYVNVKNWERKRTNRLDPRTRS